MENTNPTYDDRLRAHGERLLNALEAQPQPETYADILKAARALVAVKKALDLLHRETAMAETKAGSEAGEPPVQNRQMRRMAEALARKETQAGDYRRYASG